MTESPPDDFSDTNVCQHWDDEQEEDPLPATQELPAYDAPLELAPSETLDTPENAEGSPVDVCMESQGHMQPVFDLIPDCPVHGRLHTLLESKALDVLLLMISAPHFQRLKHLKQLGLAHEVFPGATHTRFEHSLGVCHLAIRLCHTLNKNSEEKWRIDESDIACVAMAALYHDIGHGPFSHACDLICKKLHIEWCHEEVSCTLFDLVRAEHNDLNITDSQARVVKWLIEGNRDHLPAGKRWMCDIVANHVTSIDVDKMDYLLRDALYCDKDIGFGLKSLGKLFESSKVVDDQICYLEKEAFPILKNILIARADMHLTVYTCERVQAVELMLVEALVLAATHLDLHNRINDINRFAFLDDRIRLELRHSLNTNSEALTKARELLNRIPNKEQRNHTRRCASPLDHQPHQHCQGADQVQQQRPLAPYAFAEEVLVPITSLARGWQQPTASQVCQHATGGTPLDPDQVAVKLTHINWARKDKNPLEHAKWLKYMHSTTCYSKGCQEMTNMMPACFQDTWLRVFSRDPDPLVVEALKAAFKAYCTATFTDQPEVSTPCLIRPWQARTAATSEPHLNGEKRPLDSSPSTTQGDDSPCPLPPTLMRLSTRTSAHATWSSTLARCRPET